MTSAGGRLWSAVKAHYAEWWLLFGLTWVPIFAWFTATALPAMMFIWGIPFLVYFARIRRFWPAATITAAMLVMAFLRSDFVAYLFAGHGLAAAFATKYWFAPIFIWFVSWAVIFGFDALPEHQAPKVMTWFAWLMVALAAVDLFESASGMLLRNAMNDAFYGGLRREMLVVRMSNGNAFLTMLFWPLAFHFAERRQYIPIGAMVISIVLSAILVDTNAHLLSLGSGAIVFFVVRYWPAGLRSLAPWRAMAGLTAASILLFPILVYGLMVSGLAARIKNDLLPSWTARIDIWSFTVQRALEKPWFGWGYEASRQFDPTIPNHPHNMSLQAWLELGVPGLVLLAALWFAIFWLTGPKTGYEVVKVSEDLRELGAPAAMDEAAPSAAQRAVPYILAFGTGYYIINSISFGLWRAWYYCLGALVVGVTILAIKSVDAQIKLRSQL